MEGRSVAFLNKHYYIDEHDIYESYRSMNEYEDSDIPVKVNIEDSNLSYEHITQADSDCIISNKGEYHLCVDIDWLTVTRYINYNFHNNFKKHNFEFHNGKYKVITKYRSKWIILE